MNPTIAILGIIACAVISAAGGMFYFQNVSGGKLVAGKTAKIEPKEFCIGKVIYLQFDNAVVTKLKPDGKIWTCGGV